MKRRGFLGLVAGAAFGAMLNVFPAFAPEPTFSVLTLRAGIRQDFIDTYRESYDVVQKRLREALEDPEDYGNPSFTNYTLSRWEADDA